jgi:predicted DCC family thiol-disulfide oxidoreductase YuxK
MPKENNKTKIILFDGNCVLCNTAVNFLFSRLVENDYAFVASQSNYGNEIISKYNLGALPAHTIVLIKENKILTKSDALLEITDDLTFFWRLLKIFRFIPKKMRDWIYNFISKHRYKLFGKLR